MLVTLILFNICHWLADFTPLSTKWMLNAKSKGYPSLPIMCHAMVHAMLFYSVSLFMTDIVSASHIFVLQLVSHFVIDTCKGLLRYNDPSKVMFWTVLGFDQMLHQFIIITSAYYIYNG
jgi:hypothetical protein